MNFDKRTRAREIAMQALYQLDMQNTDSLQLLDEFFAEEECNETTRNLALHWTKESWKNRKECDKLIAESTIQWHFERLSAVDKSILRLAVYQLKFCSDIPPKVVINEAIELAKKFSTEKSPSFVNGVLDAVFKKLVTRAPSHESPATGNEL